MILLLICLACLNIAAGQITFDTGNWKGLLAADSGVLQSLRPASEPSYDFSPADYYTLRNGTGNYHTGDIVLRWRETNKDSSWSTFDTAANRALNPTTHEAKGSLLHSDFSNADPISKTLNLTRNWSQEGNDLVLESTVTNISPQSTIEIGAFGFPIEFNSIFTNRSEDDTTAKCNLIDPYIGLDAGYVQVTRLTGTGPNLVVTPFGKGSKLEAWRFLPETEGPPLGYNSQTFEGFYSWEILTKAWAENEWNATSPWNVPTSAMLQPGQSITFGLRFTPVQNVYEIESAVSALQKPVAVGIPGYVIPHDLTGRLYLKHHSPVASIATDPADAIAFQPSSAKSPQWTSYTVNPSAGAFGGVRVTVTYTDGLKQTIHYVVTDPAVDIASKLSSFFLENAWFNDTSDPFGRANSIIAYDQEANAQVTQEQRAWIAGVSDEAGSIHDAIDMKCAVHPEPAEIAKLETMANTAIFGHLQDIGGSTPDGVKRSLFYHDPAALPNYTYSSAIDFSGTWNKNDSYSVWRAYNYVHASAVYYGLYRAERVTPGVLKNRTALWYLNQAYKTAIASQAKYDNGQPITSYADVGLMGETMWMDLLQDLEAENLTSQHQSMMSAMNARADKWATQSNPFGSEMPWDSTGQEPVYTWATYFQNSALQNKTLNSIRGYMPTVAHWGWNGNARRYWDFTTGGKISRIERMIHHYGSGLNALPLLTSYRSNLDPTSREALYDLRVGYGGHMGPLSNIQKNGFASTAFHSFPDTLEWDPYSGDFGPNYLGVVLGASTYLVEHPDFGWISMGGNLAQRGDTITVEPRDTVRRSIYVSSMGLSAKFDSGVITQFDYSQGPNSVTVHLEKHSAHAPKSTVMFYESTLAKTLQVDGITNERKLGGYVVSVPSKIVFSIRG